MPERTGRRARNLPRIPAGAARALLATVVVSVVVSLIVGLVAGVAGAAPALADGHKSGGARTGPAHHGHPGRVVTAAVVSNHRDGRARARLAFDVRTVDAREIAADNLAEATARCTDCRTVAVSFQVVLAGPARTTTATNQALAVNVDCVRCRTTAIAYQFVVEGPGPLRLTERGRHRLRSVEADLRRSLAEVRGDPGGDNDPLTAHVAELAGQVQAVLAEEVRQVHGRVRVAGSCRDSDHGAPARNHRRRPAA